MTNTARLLRHARLTWRARQQEKPPTPPFLVLFINSVCNLRCDHCFYWDSLNRRTDLTFAELAGLSRSLGPLDHLNLSGGEPFLRPEFAEICSMFVTNNGARQIYCPTNGFFTNRTERQLCELLRNNALEFFTAELSLDGMQRFHDKFRGKDGSFARALETYDMLAELQASDRRLQIHAITTITGENVDEARALTDFLHDRCPRMSRHNIALLRGERKRASLLGPAMEDYRALAHYVVRQWTDRENHSSAAIVDPMLHWAKEKICAQESQIARCRAGILSGVVYANGDVSLCEQHPVLGNIRQRSFPEIWHSPQAVEMRGRIRANECHCTNEIFLWPSIVFQPLPLMRAMIATGTIGNAMHSVVHRSPPLSV